MYRHTSNQTGDLCEKLVELDLITRGFVPLKPESRDYIFDLAFQDDLVSNKVIRIQVKGLTNPGKTNRSFKTSNRSLPKGGKSNERVSNTGKSRNVYMYKDYSIEWMVGVDTITSELFYYPIEVYSQYDVVNVDKQPCLNHMFPRAHVESHTHKNKLAIQTKALH